MGLSRDTFYRCQNIMADGGVEALFDANRRRPSPTNRVEDATEAAVLAYTTEQPAHGRAASAMNCASAGYSSPRPVCAPSGCATTWLPSSTR